MFNCQYRLILQFFQSSLPSSGILVKLHHWYTRTWFCSLQLKRKNKLILWGEICCYFSGFIAIIESFLLFTKMGTIEIKSDNLGRQGFIFLNRILVATTRNGKKSQTRKKKKVFPIFLLFFTLLKYVLRTN